MSHEEVEAYLADVEEPKQSTLRSLRQTILELLPEAEEGISYGMPAFKVQGKVIAGFAAFKNHLSYFPHSGSVIPQLGDDAAGYSVTKSTIHFSVDSPLPKALVEKLLAVRLDQVTRNSRR